MKVFYALGYMFLITVIISFFVAFIIHALYTILKKIEKGKSSSKEVPAQIPSIDLNNVQKEAKGQNRDGEIHAAISIALHLYSKQLHDFENMKMTINKTMKPYSPWSSKIYSVTPWNR